MVRLTPVARFGSALELHRLDIRPGTIKSPRTPHGECGHRHAPILFCLSADKLVFRFAGRQRWVVGLVTVGGPSCRCPGPTARAGVAVVPLPGLHRLGLRQLSAQTIASS